MLKQGVNRAMNPGDLLSVAVVASFFWAIWAYLRGPHDLGRLFREGDLDTPETEWRARLCFGLLLIRVSYQDISPSATPSLVYLIVALAGVGAVLSGIVKGWRLRQARRQP